MKITRVGGKISRDSLPPGGQAVQGGKINCYTGISVSFRYFSFVLVSLGTAAGEGVNSTTIQCIHEQCLTGICIFLVFYLLPMDHLCTNR